MTKESFLINSAGSGYNEHERPHGEHMASRIKLSMKPKDARRFLDDIKRLTKPKSGRPMSLTTTPDLTDHALFLFLLNSPAMKNWLNTVSQDNSFQQMRILCEIQRMGLHKFQKWLKTQSEAIDPRDADDPRNNQRFFDEQFAIQQGVIILSEAMESENITKDEVLHRFIDTVVGSDWTVEAADSHSGDESPSLHPHSGSQYVCELAATTALVSTTAEAKASQTVQKAAHALRSLVEHPDNPHNEHHHHLPRFVPPPDLMTQKKDDEDDS